ncbi:Phosphatidylglycerophosphatase A [Candidatus Arsenophonus lipoptenae]|uniref:Phosphatidylglycerophosphatase A n=1 Tax=Candidatus Arsenophonus lipoptenae TaxID=634113 RepID=A0A0X9VIM6_9GAMM|nr:phosphatidylglycerophosphatase A [Candidatus Arsenophonus lipoptenae]AMA64825.1 Phosphatidylglycerophosphatase A [Candidatus Arsenophonus lipoptenae]
MTNYKFTLKLSNPYHLLATGFGSGLSPVIPGTIGSLAAIPCWLFMHKIFSVLACWFIILFGFIIGIIVCQRTSNDIKIYDHKSIVWDEFIGMWITLMYIPLSNWKWLLISFLLFRFFDILKPWPIIWFDRKIHKGIGIMLDDIIASIFAIIIMEMFKYWFFY